MFQERTFSPDRRLRGLNGGQCRRRGSGRYPVMFSAIQGQRYAARKFGTPARHAALKSQAEFSLIYSALRAWDFSPDRRLGRLRGARALLALRGSDTLIFLPFGHGIFRLPGDWDACAARGKVGPVMGLRPLRGPPCIPPEAPPRRFSTSFRWRGHASCAAGASLTRSARSGDLPPRRVNAIARYSFGWKPLQPRTIEPFNT